MPRFTRLFSKEVETEPLFDELHMHNCAPAKLKGDVSRPNRRDVGVILIRAILIRENLTNRRVLAKFLVHVSNLFLIRPPYMCMRSFAFTHRLFLTTSLIHAYGTKSICHCNLQETFFKLR